MAFAPKSWLAETRHAVDAALEDRLAFPGLPPGPERTLADAMSYAVLGAGKRVRPALAVAACEAVGGSRRDALPVACAVELLHAYTLVHDDLPAMDDDDMRRGKPTVHVAYDQATALLAGDALLTEAFAALADLEARTADAVRVLAKRVGVAELLGGQAIDIAGQGAGAPPSFEQLEHMHCGKTGALFAASAELGAIAGGATTEQRSELARLGMHAGIAFQHGDDREDNEFQSMRERADARVRELADDCLAIAQSFGDPGAPLTAMARLIALRTPLS